MKIVLDTNVIVAAFLTRGTCAELFEHCLDEHEICVCPQILDELEEALGRRIALPGGQAKEIVRFVAAHATVVDVGGVPRPSACRDEDDNGILAAAMACDAGCIVTGDADLLVLGEHAGVPIVAPGDFWRFEARGPSRG